MTLSRKDPLTGELVPSYHTVEATKRKRAERGRDELILELERKGSAQTSKLTLGEFLDEFVRFKEEPIHRRLPLDSARAGSHDGHGRSGSHFLTSQQEAAFVTNPCTSPAYYP